MGSETIHVDRNVRKKNNTNFFVGLVYIVQLSSLKKQGIWIGVIDIPRYIVNIPKTVSLKIMETAHTVGYIYTVYIYIIWI